MSFFKLKRISAILFYIVITFDFITKIILTYNLNILPRFSLIPKALINIVLLFLLIKAFDFKKHKYVILFFLVLLSSFSAFLLLYQNSNIETILKQLYTLSLYSYFFILITFFNSLKENLKMHLLEGLKKAVINVGIISCILMIIGFLADIELFRSYQNTNRFGFNGIFLKTSEASYFFIFLITLAYFDYVENKKNKFLLLLFLSFSVFLGTKIIWLFLTLFFIYVLSINYKKITGLIILTIPIIYLFFRNQIDVFLIRYLPNGEILYKENNIITVLTSTRDLLLDKTIGFMSDNWMFYNYLIGGNKYASFKVEFEFFDLFSLFGIFGLLLFLFFLKKEFFKKAKNCYKTHMLIIVLICAFFAGNFFKSFMCVTLLYTVFGNTNYKIITQK